MPLLVIEIVDLPSEREHLCQALAQACALALQSRPSGTWVRLRQLEGWQYAENGPATSPAFVSLTLADCPEDPAPTLARVAAAVAECLGRSVDSVHVILEPPARGRIAFGGHLLT